MSDPTQRFTDRVDDYVKYRPSYPPTLLDVLRRECGLTPDDVVADVGAGTGILTELFLRNGNPVFAVEPNDAMRAAAERALGHEPRFTSVPATAEATTLPDEAVDYVVAGQAFHWFDQAQARREFARILRPEGWAVLVWNDRRTEASPFLVAYEQLLQTYGTDYQAVDHKQTDETVLRAFFRADYGTAVLPNVQVFDFEGLRGRLLSSSYTPPPGHPQHGPMLAALKAIFDAHQKAGHVLFEYDTRLYFGRL